PWGARWGASISDREAGGAVVCVWERLRGAAQGRSGAGAALAGAKGPSGAGPIRRIAAAAGPVGGPLRHPHRRAEQVGAQRPSLPLADLRQGLVLAPLADGSLANPEEVGQLLVHREPE